MVTLVGQVKLPGKHGEGDAHGLVGGAGLSVAIFVCEQQDRKTCLAMPPPAIATAITDVNGRFSVTVSADLVSGKLLGYVATLEENHVLVTVRRLVTPHDRGETSGAQPAARLLTADLADLEVDPISEAAVQLLEEQGLENYSDDGVDAVNQAVTLANEASVFAGNTTAEAVTAAATVAASDPEVQTVLEANRTPTPVPTAVSCAGDCDGSGVVTVDELIIMVNIALDNAAIGACEAGDANHDGQITVDEIITAVNKALGSC
jgi:hypothetical protein